jgi:hypothetical protein
MAAALVDLQRGPVRAELYRDVDWPNIIENLGDAKKYPHHAVIVLQLSRPSWGHYWCLCRRGPGLRTIELADSTGRRPDELRDAMPDDLAASLGQAGRPLTDALRAAQARGFTLRFNDLQAQPDAAGSNTCGWWSLLRGVNSHLDEYQFLDKVREAARGYPSMDKFVEHWGEGAAKNLRSNTMDGGAAETADEIRDLELRPLSTLPETAIALVDALRVPPLPGIVSADAQLAGSFILRVQPFPSDVDVMTEVIVTPTARPAIAKLMARAIRSVVATVQKKYYFSDLKCGETRKGEALHWTADEVARGVHAASKMTLLEAIDHPTAICKIDLIAPVLGRYIEASSFYHVRSEKGGPFNFVDTSPAMVAAALVADAKELVAKKPPKLLKAVKRLYSAARLKDDFATLNALAPVLRSGASNLGAASSDLECLARIVELGFVPNRRTATEEVSQLAFRLSSVTDIEGWSPAAFSAESAAAIRFLYAGDRTSFLQTFDRLRGELLRLTNRAVRVFMAAPEIPPPLRQLFA